MLMNLLTIAVFLLMFSVLVAVHEWGHYLLARKFNMGVSEFSIGMGPLVKTWKRKKYTLDSGEEAETEFNIRAFPLGGFVKILGMEPKEDGSEIHEKGGFFSKGPIQRIVTLLAGPVFSIAFGWLLFLGIFTMIGMEKPITKIGTVSINGPADKAGVKPGDRVLKVNDVEMKDTISSIRAIRASKGEPVKLTYLHEGQTLEKIITPIMSKDELFDMDNEGNPTDTKAHYPILGLTYAAEYKRVPIGEAVISATSAPILMAKAMVTNILRPKRILEESTGVIGMAVGTRMAMEQGLTGVLSLSALISISLGFMNLLPIGILDGGQIFIAVIEWLRGGKRLSIRTQAGFLYGGLAVILFFFVAVTYKDLFRFVIPGEQNVLNSRTSEFSNNAPSSNNAPVK